MPESFTESEQLGNTLALSLLFRQSRHFRLLYQYNVIWFSKHTCITKRTADWTSPTLWTKFNLWNPSSKHTAKVKNHIKTFAQSYCGLLNARSINNKDDSIYELITDNYLDVLTLTETWCIDNSDVSLGLVTPPGYAIVQTHRSSWGGGVGVIYHVSIRDRLEKYEKYSSFELQTVTLFSDSDV